MQVLTQFDPQATQNQDNAARMSVLCWFYRVARETLRRWRYGEAMPNALAERLIVERFVCEQSDGDSREEIGTELGTRLAKEREAEREIESAERCKIAEMEELEIRIEELCAKQHLTPEERDELEKRHREYNEFGSWPPESVPGFKFDRDPLQERLRRVYDRSVLEDWAKRYWHGRLHQLRASEPQPKRFVRLLHGEGTERFRELINQAWFVRGRKFVLSRKEFQRIFSRIIAELPRADDAKIETLATCFAAVAAGYAPSTGFRILAGTIVRCHCCDRPAVMEVEVPVSSGALRCRPWCGECDLQSRASRKHPTFRRELSRASKT